MGCSNHLFVKAKTFVFSAEEGCLVLSFVKRSRGVSHAVHLGKVSVAWLSETVKALIRGGGLREFVKSWKVGSTAYIAQRCSNRHGRYLVLAKYSSGGQRGFIVLLEGQERQGWKECAFCSFFRVLLGWSKRCYFCPTIILQWEWSSSLGFSWVCFVKHGGAAAGVQEACTGG